MDKIRGVTWATMAAGFLCALVNLYDAPLMAVIGGMALGAGMVRAVDAIRGVGQDVYRDS